MFAARNICRVSKPICFPLSRINIIKNNSTTHAIRRDATCQSHLSPADFWTMSLEEELTAAAARGDTARVTAVLREGAQVNGVNRFGRTALQVMMMGSTPVAQVLLDHSADPNVADPRTGSTPLHDAARTGYVDTVRLLLKFKADPTARDINDCRPVDLALDAGHAEVVCLLESV